MKYRRLCGLVAVLAMATVGVARAQEAPPAPAAPAGAGVKLAYKYRPGLVTRYRCATTGTMTIDLSKMGLPTGAGQAPAAMPMDLSMQFDLVQKVKSVDADGTATVAQTLDAMQMNYKMMGQNVVMKTQNGKLVFTMNGQPMPAPPNAQGGAQVIGQTFEAKLAPTGKVTELKGELNQQLKGLFGGQDISELFGAGLPGLGMLVLPVEPLQIGQQWTNETSVTMPLPLPGAAGAGAVAPKIDYKIQYTLKEIQQKGARQVALIESRMEITMPHTDVPLPQGGNAPGGGTMSMDNYSQTVTGTHYFDVTDGAFRMADHNAKLGMQMKMNMPGAPGGGPTGAMGIDGSFNMKVSVIPNTPAKVASAKAAAAKGNGTKGKTTRKSGRRR
jgi:hypothetical protein